MNVGVSRATVMWPATALRKLNCVSQHRSFSSEWTHSSSSSCVRLGDLAVGRLVARVGLEVVGDVVGEVGEQRRAEQDAHVDRDGHADLAARPRARRASACLMTPRSAPSVRLRCVYHWYFGEVGRGSRAAAWPLISSKGSRLAGRTVARRQNRSYAGTAARGAPMSEHPNIPATPQPSTPPWRGINHLALVTDDMDATVRFYHGTLGARLVATIGTPEFKHYFFEFGPECTVAFFEYTDTSTSGWRSPRARPIPSPSSSTTSRSTCPTKRRCSTCSAVSRARDVRSPTSSTTRSSGRSTSPTPTASHSRRRGGCSTRPADRRTTATPRSSPTPIRCLPCESSPSRASCPQCPTTHLV